MGGRKAQVLLGIGGVAVGVNMGVAEIGAIVAGVIIVVGFIYWRIAMSRKEKGKENENPD
jgi:hypothetical protein